jgi:hypothetical protein
VVVAADKARVPTETGAASTAAWHASVTNIEPAKPARPTELAAGRT